MAARNYKIGQVASRLGISVRTLRHYDAVGVLTPASRASTGHRLYTEHEVSRLQKVVSLRRMGFSLDEVRTMLSGDAAKAFTVLEVRAKLLRLEISKQQDILKRVEDVLGFGEMHKQFKEALSVTGIKERSTQLQAELAAEMERGTDPKDARVQALIQQIEELGRKLMPDIGREKVLKSLKTFRETYSYNWALIPQADVRQIADMNERMQGMRRLFEYVKRAKA